MMRRYGLATMRWVGTSPVNFASARRLITPATFAGSENDWSLVIVPGETEDTFLVTPLFEAGDAFIEAGVAFELWTCNLIGSGVIREARECSEEDLKSLFAEAQSRETMGS